MSHGTDTEYSSRGCRCDDCRKAASAARSLRRRTPRRPRAPRGRSTDPRRVREYTTIARIRANPEISECEVCGLMKPASKPVCECCNTEALGTRLSDYREVA